MLKMGRIACYDLNCAFASSKCRMQGIVNSATHDPSAARFSNCRFVIRQGQCFHCDQIVQTQSQLGCRIDRHFVKAAKRGECFRNGVSVCERSRGIFERRKAGFMFRVRPQERSNHYARIEKSHRV